MVGLGLDAPSPHLRQAVGRGQNKRIPLAEELDRSRGFAAAPATVQVAQAVVVKRRGAGSEILFYRFVVRLSEVGCIACSTGM